MFWCFVPQLFGSWVTIAVDWSNPSAYTSHRFYMPIWPYWCKEVWYRYAKIFFLNQSCQLFSESDFKNCIAGPWMYSCSKIKRKTSQHLLDFSFGSTYWWYFRGRHVDDTIWQFNRKPLRRPLQQIKVMKCLKKMFTPITNIDYTLISEKAPAKYSYSKHLWKIILKNMGWG